MKEVEVKAKVKSLDKLQKKLEGKGAVFKEPQIQKDVIFLHKDSSRDRSRRGKVILRLRQTDEVNILTLKKQLGNELDNIEHEIVVDNWVAAKNIINLLDYDEVVRVYKVRKEGKLGDLSICLDEVRGLGDFIEVEKVVKKGNSSKIQDELFSFLETLGVKYVDRVEEGYDSLVYKKLCKSKT